MGIIKNMADGDLPSPEILRELLHCNPEDGRLFWKKRERKWFKSDRDCNAWNTRYSGQEAFTANSRGYRSGKILNVMLFAHRVVWAVHYGKWPSDEIDHINGNKSDNQIKNLREATHAENLRNVKRSAKNTSGAKGVCFDRSKNKWMSRIARDGKEMFLGYFDTVELAHAAYASVAPMVHGEFKRLE